MSTWVLSIPKKANRTCYKGKLSMLPLARFLIIFGVVLVLAGSLIYLLAKSGLNLGQLPGDIRIQNGNMTCVIALGTSILLSIILTIVLNLAGKFLNK
jgi:hypothetical protein